MQRAEPGARALGLREPDDGEVSRAVEAHLDPVPGAGAAVGRVGLLSDDALEAELARRLEQLLAPGLDVVGESHRPGAGQQPLEESLAVRERERPQVEVLEAEQIEGEERRGQLDGGAVDVGSALEERPLLEQPEARLRLSVEDHDLAVEHEGVAGEGADRAGDLGKGRRRVHAVAVAKHGLSVLAAREQAVAVVLELPDPAGLRERRSRAARRA